MESVWNECNGDVDLGNGALQEQYAAYCELLNSIKDISKCDTSFLEIQITVDTEIMTSDEPGRKLAYSDDIRWHIVWQKIGMELPYRTIASNLNVSLGTVHNIYQRYVDTGIVTPKQQPCKQQLRSLNQQD